MVPQAGLFSAVLTAFVVDSKQNLQPSPADETVYYLRQHSTILSQISVQLSSIAPQVTIPSTPPPPFPAFSPLASNIRVNVFWFMSLAFSLVAALLAILVQQWVRNYMHVFQRYGDPLKSSRLRQYLYEGCERWFMPKVAEFVPGFLHISLFLFFAGLGDSLLNINTKVALSTIVPIGTSGLLYIFMTFAPILYPQSPYQNSFSGIFWYLFQKLLGRRFKDHGSDGKMRSVSTNMAQGRMQLAMEETVTCKNRDVRAIRWLIDNMTEDAEMETFLSAIPGSFNTDWGTEVWKRVGKHHENEDQSRRHPRTRPTTHSPEPHPSNVVHELSTRVARSIEACNNHKPSANTDSLWRKRSRACIETTASLVCCANAKLAWFGGISKLLGDIGRFERMRELSLAGTDELFVIRWTCLSLTAIRPILAGEVVHQGAMRAIELLAEEDDTSNMDALVAALKIDDSVQKAKDCLFQLHDALPNTEDPTEDVKEILYVYESLISEVNIGADRLKWVDYGIIDVQNAINNDQIISQFPGIFDHFDPDYQAPIPFNRLVDLSHHARKLQFICPGKTLKSMCSPALTLRNILEGQEDTADAYKELLKNLTKFPFRSGWRGDEMQRQLWRLQDLHDGGGLGFTVELFFLALSQLVSTSSSKESHSALYTGTFRAITSDWSKRKYSLGTQNLLLHIAMSRRWEFDGHYPDYVVDEFLLLLGSVFAGQTGPHIDEAKLLFERVRIYGSKKFSERALGVLMSIQTE